LGGAALFLFALQAATGCLLMLYYQPSEAAAHESVRQIMTQVPYGWLIRSVHAWGASLFIATVAVHFLSVLFTRAYRKPRELTWLSGMAMLLLALGFGFSGYLLPWNDLAFSATRVGTAVFDGVPLLGGAVMRLLRGGEEVTGATLTRFFAFHVAFLPIFLGGFVLLHLFLVQMQGTGLPLGIREHEVRDRRPFFSEFLPLEACLWLVLLGALVTLAVFWPAELGEKADLRRSAPVGIKPEWFFWFMFKTLKVVPEWLGIALFAALGLFFVVLPFLDRNASSERRSPRFTAGFVLVLAYVAVFQLLAWLEPNVEREPETLLAPTYSLPSGAVTLGLLWAVIALLIYYLRQLAAENRRIRQLYCGSERG
jgi:cytochrome b6